MIGHANNAAFRPCCCTVARNVAPDAIVSAAAFIACDIAKIPFITATIPAIAA